LALTAGITALALVFAGCLGGPDVAPPVTVGFLTDASISAQPGWTVGWPVNVGQTVGDNQSAGLTVSAPSGWTAYFLKPSLNFSKSGTNATSFLLVDIPASTEEGTYAVSVEATVGDRGASAAASVEVSRPGTNVLRNGSQVSMDYVGFLESNEVFDTSVWAVASAGLDKWPDFVNNSATRVKLDYNPLQLTLGRGQVIKGWDLGLQNMSLGQSKALIVPPELAYGRFFDQMVNLTQEFPLYNETTVQSFTRSYGEPPSIDAEFKDPLYGWTVRVVDVDNVSQAVVLQNLPQAGETYTPYGVNATAANLSSASGTFEVHFAPEMGQDTTNLMDTGEVVEVNATNFTMRWQTEHRQALAPHTLYFLVFVRTAL
jgi:FKBP-type peptidyl-prolyl cis-trans isomerase 2